MYLISLLIFTYSLGHTLAKLSWKGNLPQQMCFDVKNAFESSEYYVQEFQVTFLDYWTSSLPNDGHKMLVICVQKLRDAEVRKGPKGVNFFLAMVNDDTGNLKLTRRSTMHENVEAIKACAEYYVYSNFGFRENWLRTKHSNLHSTVCNKLLATVDLQSQYPLQNYIIIKAWMVESGKAVVVYQHSDVNNRRSDILLHTFCIWLRTDQGKFEKICRKAVYGISELEKAIFDYLSIATEFGEPWRRPGNGLERFLSTSDVKLLEAQVAGALGATASLVQAKRTRGDSTKVVAEFSKMDSMWRTLVMFSVWNTNDTQKEFTIFHHEEVKDLYTDDKATAYLSYVFPFTQHWKAIRNINYLEESVVKKIVDLLKDYKQEKGISSFGLILFKNIDFAFKKKVAIFSVKLNDAGAMTKSIFVAWTANQNNQNISIKQVSPLFDLKNEAEDALAAFTFYGNSALAYLEDTFKNGTGWYKTEDIPSFLKDTMKIIMEDYKSFAQREKCEGSKFVSTWQFDNDYYWLQKAGRIATGEFLPGTAYYELVVKPKRSKKDTCSIVVRCVNEHYIEVVCRKTMKP